MIVLSYNAGLGIRDDLEINVEPSAIGVVAESRTENMGVVR